jgi:phasin
MATGPKKTAVTPAPAPEDATEASVAPVAAAVEETAKAVDEAPKAIEAPAAALSELQGNLRSVVEKGLVETRAAYAKAKTSADETASALETSYAAAKAGVVAINAKALEALRANVEANFDFMKSAIAVKNVADFVTLQGEFTRKRLEAMTDQTKELSALAQKLAAETAEPIKGQVAKTLRIAV